MERLTKNKATEDMSMYELAHNCCYIDKDGNARYRDFEIDVDARGFVRKIGKEIRLFETGCAELIDDESFDATMIDWLQYGYSNVYGLLALIYRNLWAMAEFRERLKAYEDLQEMIGIPFEEFAELCKKHQPDDCKNPSKAIILTDESVDEWNQYKTDKEQGLLLRLPCKIGSTVFKITEDWAEYKDGEIIVDAPFGNYTVENYILVHWKICEHKDVSLQWILENFGFFENGVYLDRAKAEEELMIQPTTIHSIKQKTWVWKPGLAEMKGV